MFIEYILPASYLQVLGFDLLLIKARKKSISAELKWNWECNAQHTIHNFRVALVVWNSIRIFT